MNFNPFITIIIWIYFDFMAVELSKNCAMSELEMLMNNRLIIFKIVCIINTFFLVKFPFKSQGIPELFFVYLPL